MLFVTRVDLGGRWGPGVGGGVLVAGVHFWRLIWPRAIGLPPLNKSRAHGKSINSRGRFIWISEAPRTRSKVMQNRKVCLVQKPCHGLCTQSPTAALANSVAVLHAPGPGRLVHYRTWDHVLFLHHMPDTAIGSTHGFHTRNYGLPSTLPVPVALQLS